MHAIPTRHPPQFLPDALPTLSEAAASTVACRAWRVRDWRQRQELRPPDEDETAIDGHPATPPLLIVEDSDTSAAVMAAAVGGGHDVVHAASVGEAIKAVRGWASAGVRVTVALDLVLDNDATPLHETLAALGWPVVVVSGYESERGRQTAARRGWSFLAKPFTEEDFRAALESARKEGTVTPMTMPDPQPQASPESAPSSAAADNGTPAPPAAATGVRLPSDAPLHADPTVAKADLLSRRALRGAVALLITGLTVYGDMTGHPVSGVTVAILGMLGMGASAFIEAAKKRPAATAIGGTGIAVLAISGDLLSIPEAGQAAALAAAGATALVDVARGSS